MKRQKRQKRLKSQSEVHGGYTAKASFRSAASIELCLILRHSGDCKGSLYGIVEHFMISCSSLFKGLANAHCGICKSRKSVRAIPEHSKNLNARNRNEGKRRRQKRCLRAGTEACATAVQEPCS